MLTVSSVSVREPIWFTFTRIELAVPVSMPFLRNSVLVTKRSSPTICTFLPSLSVSSFQLSQSFSAQPSSMEMIGYLETSSAYRSTIWAPVSALPSDFLNTYRFFSGT